MSSDNLSSRAIGEVEWFKKRFARQLENLSPDGVVSIDMATAENWLIRQDILQVVKRATASLDSSDLSYTSGLGGSKATLEAAAKFFNHFFRPAKGIKPLDIVVGPGASSMLDTLFHCICDEGDAVLVEAPYWGSFEISCMMRNRVKLIAVYPPSSPCSHEEYIEAFKMALDQAPCKVRAFLFCNPQNPRAQIYSHELIVQLMTFCNQNDLHFISDEVYALTTFGRLSKEQKQSEPYEHASTYKFTSVAEIDLERLRLDSSRVHLLHSISKDLGSSGLRLGFIVTQANPMLRFALAVLNHNKVSTATARIGEALLSDTPRLEKILNSNTLRLRESAKILIDFLEARNIRYYEPVAGVYVWACLGEADGESRGDECLTRVFAQKGVSVGNGADYSEHQNGWFRLTFALPREQLLEGLRRVANALDMDARVDGPAEKTRCVVV